MLLDVENLRCEMTWLFAVRDHDICRDFSRWGAFWRRFFASVVLRVGKDGKGAYFEWQLIDSRLQEDILKRGVKKVCGRHDMLSNGTKDDGKRGKEQGAREHRKKGDKA